MRFVAAVNRAAPVETFAEKTALITPAARRTFVLASMPTQLVLKLKIIEPRSTFAAYTERIMARPAAQRANERNFAIAEEKGLNKK